MNGLFSDAYNNSVTANIYTTVFNELPLHILSLSRSFAELNSQQLVFGYK